MYVYNDRSCELIFGGMKLGVGPGRNFTFAGWETEGEKMRKKHWSDHIFKDLQKSVNLFGKR